jgi:hypothetical protein
VTASDLELGASLLERDEELCIKKREPRLTGECLEQVERLLREVTGRLATYDERPDDLFLREHRHRDNRPPAVIEEDLQVWIEVDQAQVGDGDRPTLLCCAPDQGGVDVDAHAAQLVNNLW